MTVRITLFLLLAAATQAVPAEDPYITLSSTTSTQASGFFDAYLPKVRAATGIDVRVVAVGSGQALKLGEQGDADLLLVHDKPGELAFVAAGYGTDRRELMYNDFVLLGPQADPAQLRGGQDAVAAMRTLADRALCFASRGDDSGTHRAERRLWSLAGVDARAASGTWYKELGTGMGETLNTATGLGCHVLADRATWLGFANRGPLVILVEHDPRLFNQYSLIRVSRTRHPHVKWDAARKVADWMVSPDGQAAIGEYRISGVAPFHPNYRATVP